MMKTGILGIAMLAIPRIGGVIVSPVLKELPKNFYIAF
jgi:hypothetical protein